MLAELRMGGEDKKEATWEKYEVKLFEDVGLHIRTVIYR